MEHFKLGMTDLTVSQVALGTITFGEEWGWGTDRQTAARVYDAYREAGGIVIDTADIYTDGTSERMIGELTKLHRDEIVISTKLTINADSKHQGQATSTLLMESVDHSLQRLQTDFIDLYWIQPWDHETPIEQSVAAMDQIVRAGKVRYVGICNAPAWRTTLCLRPTKDSNVPSIAAIQIDYNLLERTVEREIIPCARNFSLPIFASTPLCGGLLSGKYESTVPENARYSNRDMHCLLPDRLDPCPVSETITAVSEEQGCSRAQVAIAWLLHQQPGVIPVIGATSVEQIRENLGAMDVRLNDEQLMRLDEISLVDPGFPQRCYDQRRVQVYRSCGAATHQDRSN